MVKGKGVTVTAIAASACVNVSLGSVVLAFAALCGGCVWDVYFVCQK